MLKTAYIATPYSHPDQSVRHRRYKEACLAVKSLSNAYVVYSPIAHWHPIALDFRLPTDAMFWKNQNEGIIDRLEVVIVCQFEGWDTSKGVRMEIEYATLTGKELIYVDPSEF